MIQNDLSLWPLVLSIARGVPTYEELRSFSTDWERWLDRGERFATLRIYMDAAAHTYPEGGAQEKKRWFQANGERLKSRVIAIASVVPADILSKVQRIDAEKLFGVPVRTFAQIDPAIGWVGAHFAEQGLRVDPENIEAALKRLMV